MATRRKKAPAPFEVTPEMRVVLLHGREPFIMRERSRQVAEALEQAHGEIEQFVFDGADADLAIVLDELRSYGLMQQHKLVVLDRADQFLSGQEGRRHALERYCAAPVDHATLLLRAETWRPGNLDKLIKKVGCVYKIEAASEAEATRWCIKRCEHRYETTIEPDAAAALVAQTGPNLDRLDAELSKLASFAGPAAPITTAVVAELVGLSREQQAWVIQSAVASGEPSTALRTMRELVEVSRQPEQLIGWALTDLARKLHAAARLLQEGHPVGVVARELRLWGESRDQVIAIAGRLEPERLAQLLRCCIETDRRGKRGYGDSVRSLEALTVLLTDSIRAG
ncbi:MAG: DNA polymerase III subunit delta [Planctomycetota bacterium]|jgi:DNA polymerase-3 subunit delta